MKEYSKAIGAAIGGAAAGGGLGLLLPDGSPWYAYILMVLVTSIAPALAAYISPKNSE